MESGLRVVVDIGALVTGGFREVATGVVGSVKRVVFGLLVVVVVVVLVLLLVVDEGGGGDHHSLGFLVVVSSFAGGTRTE